MTHGNGTADERQYYGKEENYRLKLLRTLQGATTHLSYGYSQYRDTGQLEVLADNKHASTSPISNRGTFSYDGLGRLLQVTNSNYAGVYQHDGLGNMTSKEGVALTPRTDKPHMLQKIGTATVTSDWNGNRLSTPTQRFKWDAEYRLREVDVGAIGWDAKFVYDHTGQMVERIDPSITRYYFGLVEVRGNTLIKHYNAGGLRIASRSGPAPASLEFVRAGEPAVRLARNVDRPSLTFLVRPDAAPWICAVTMVFLGSLLLWPAGRPPSLGFVVRKGHVLFLIVAFGVASVPLPLSFVINGGSEAWAAALPTPVPTVLEHHHPDHLGSAHLVTDSAGGCKRYLRYRAFGQATRFACGSTSDATINRFEFTGYEHEQHSGIQYAGARHYDPATGMFLSHDPARQFASPYAYGPGDPINGTDPNGEFWWVPIILAFVVGAVASAVVAHQAGASFGEGLKAAAIGGAIGAATAAGLGLVGAAVGATKSAAIQIAYQAALLGSSAYGAAESFSNGQGGLGAAAVVGLAFSAVGLGEALNDEYGARAAQAPEVARGRGQTRSPYVRHASGRNMSTTPDDIRAALADWAESQIGNTDYAQSKAKGGFKNGDPKCNLFVHDGLEAAGLHPPVYPGKWPVRANDWANPNYNVARDGFATVSEPMPGDIASFRRANYGHVGIVGTSGDIIAANEFSVGISSSHLAVLRGDGASVGATSDIVYRRYLGPPL